MTVPRKAGLHRARRGGALRLRVAERGRARLALTAAAVAACVVAAGTGSAQATAQADQSSKLYLVQTVGQPLASYEGGVAGIAATKPAPGESLDTSSAAATAYRSYLTKQHKDVLARSGVSASNKGAEYGVAFNGFAARLTDAEVARLKATPGVTKVWPNEVVKADTITTPQFLGLTGQTGVWQSQFDSPQRAGEGVIVGVIDSGIWSENPAFGPLSEPRPDKQAIAKKWHGTCVAGDEEPISCNNKLIGARWYNEGGLAADYEFLSPRDFNGHGSHTSSTAAGDYNVPASINGGLVGTMSGMAPAARLAMYKALWHQASDGSASGATADLVHAIDDAVADGVDVINYSISGSRLFVVDPVEIAFLNAAAAGVFVSTSAGNAGDTVGVSSVAHNSPWLATVAASTHDRGAVKHITLGNGATYTGVGVGVGVGPAPTILAANAGLAGVDPLLLSQCWSDTDPDTAGAQAVLDPAKVAGKIVVCDRGGNARVDKSLAVANAGGVGMIQVNLSNAQSLNADFHSVPSIHLNATDGAAVKAYVAGAGAGATATISGVDPAPVRAPQMGGFSSFGPAIAGGGDLLKPDLTAPGVDVIAAVAPPGNGGNNFFAYSGTSMSSPHVAGIAALLKSKNKKWSPMWIKSALMTTATTLDNTGQPIRRGAGNATPLDYGSGHIVPAKAFNPGLVYDSTPTDWLRYGCGIGQIQLITAPSFCASVGSIDPSDLNYPSIAVGDLAGTQTITRTVTNVLDKNSIYTANVQAPAGVTATVSPPSIFLKSGGSASFTVTLTRTTATLGQWAFGSLTWTDGLGPNRNHAVRSPIVVRPVALAAPPEVAGSGTSGSSTLSLRAGYTGTLTAAVAGGLTPSTVTELALDASGPDFNSNTPATSIRTGMVPVTVPAGTVLARFATFDADYGAGTDVDLYAYRVSGTTRTLVATSAGGTAEESITLTAPGDYQIFAVLFAVPGNLLTVKHNHWVVPPGPAGNLTVSPASQSVTTGGATSVTAGWSGLTGGTRYLGAIDFGDGTSTVGRTIIGITG